MDDKFELSDGSYYVYSVPDTSDFLKCIIKKHETLTDNPSIRIHIKKIKNRITFKIKTGYYIQRLIPETRKLRRSTKNNIMEDKNGENVPNLL